MPELPDVEYFRRYLARTALHQRITDVSIQSPKILGVSPQRLRGRLTGRSLTGTHRHGKWLLAALDDHGALALHFGMTAFLRYVRHGNPDARHDRISLRFTNGAQLAFNDQRLFGRVTVAEDAGQFIKEQRLGPDALTVRWPEFRAIVRRRRGGLKALLMDQRALAGLGNLYVDEILFQVRLHPLTRTDRLSESQVRVLYQTMGRILRTAIRLHADPDRLPMSWLFGHRTKQGRCARCGGPLTRITAAGRTTIFCPTCQLR